MRILPALISLTVAATTVLHAQAPAFPSFSDWDIVDSGGRTLTYLGRPSLFLARGIALMPGEEMADGSIDFDVAIHGQAGFAGVLFRSEGNDDYELIYLRTHRSRQWDALQYTPMIAGQEAWQLYSGDGYSGVAELPANRWLHIRVVIAGYRAEVFVDHAPKPQLVVTDLKRPWQRRRVGLWGRAGAASFSNMVVTPAVAPVAPVRPTVQVPGGVVGRWAISQSLATADLPTDRIPDGLTWERVDTEGTGLLNISRYRRPVPHGQVTAATDVRDTVFARTTVRAVRSTRLKLAFGYSDEVTIFLDGQPVFSGRAGFLERDRSFLGTVSLGADAVYLDVPAGRHELTFAVAETTGGWGVIARIEGDGVAVD